MCIRDRAFCATVPAREGNGVTSWGGEE